MPASKYIDSVSYLLRMEAEDKRNYEAAARAARLSLADWINFTLRANLRKKNHLFGQCKRRIAMMRIFVIHSYSDKTAVRREIAKLRAICSKVKIKPVFLKKQASKTWLEEARSLLDKSHFAICFASMASVNSANVKSEIELTEVLKKPLLVYRLENELEVPKCLFESKLVEIVSNANDAREFVYENYFLNKEFRSEFFNEERMEKTIL